jgi:hypothetical protein
VFRLKDIIRDADQFQPRSTRRARTAHQELGGFTYDRRARGSQTIREIRGHQNTDVGKKARNYQVQNYGISQIAVKLQITVVAFVRFREEANRLLQSNKNRKVIQYRIRTAKIMEKSFYLGIS